MTAPALTLAGAGGPAATRRTSTLTGTTTLARLALRRHRVRFAGWALVLAALVAATAASLADLYPTAADRVAYAALTSAVPTTVVLNGPTTALDTLGGMTVFEIGWYVAIAVAALAITTVARDVRGEEESGRTELVRAAPAGRHAPLAGALLSTAAGLAVVVAAVVGAMLAVGLPVPGTLAYGAALLGVGLVFAAVTAVTAQVTEHARGASGIGAGVLGVAFALRAVGDLDASAASWFSPLGWAQALRPFGDERWWPLALTLATATGLVLLTTRLADRRDVGAGLLPPRPGPPVASRRLAGPAALTARLLRSGTTLWCVALLAGGVALGTIAQDMDDVVGTAGELGDLLGDGSVVDAYLALVALLLGVAVAGYVVAGVLRLRAEEAQGRAEPVLAAPVGRWRWAGAHLAVVAGGSVLVTVSGGLGLAAAVRASGAGDVLPTFAAVLAHLPAAWVVGALAVLLVGWAPRLSGAAWLVVAGALVVSLLGGVLGLPAAVVDLSPFEHVPALPGGPWEPVPLLVLTGIAAVATTLGLAGLRRRDIG